MNLTARKRKEKAFFFVMHYMALFYRDISIQTLVIATFSRCLICVEFPAVKKRSCNDTYLLHCTYHQ